MSNVILRLKQFTQASRMLFLPIMVICIALGTLAAYLWNDVFHPVLFLIALIGSCAAHLFSTMFNDFWDYLSGADVAAYETEDTASTDSGFLTQKIWSLPVFLGVTLLMGGIAALSGLILFLTSGWGVIPLCVIGGFLAFFYVAPPVRFGYWGLGTSELAHVICFGVLPVMGAFYVQTSHFDWKLLPLSLPIGLLTTLVFFNHHFLHWKTDRQVGKRTLVVSLGESRSFRLSTVIFLLVCLSVIVCVLTNTLPVYALLALITAWPLIRMYRSMRSERNLQSYKSLMAMSMTMTIRCGAILIAAMFVQGFSPF
ncbi:prenyltransferase [Saccharibacillus kuerlensis]|uniref:1,4-dihydroxy-2-naphthoate octaprenyltransferase n=1 Tax=Saccharibacillus kuerlensis TaxID=459527 RepID=A0ABQ2L0U5_9BACL|nr:prenyltransferase [Saccharibacillus kuerlensis]GGN98690.1 1,4-dihydroxy-2-naphthoate octaprenyltransferase [Saccharibacillus kuerlensis]